jgi:uncharacterized protein
MNTIDEDLIREITQRLVREFRPEQVILFGSHAWGSPNQFSDLDLLVIVSESNLSDYERAIRGRRCLRDLHAPKDILVRTRAEFDFFRGVRASLEHRIFERGKVLYERGETPIGDELGDQSAA